MMLTEQILSGLIPGLPKAQIRMMAVPYYVGQIVMTWAKHERMLAGMLARIRQVDYEKLRDNLLDGQIKEYEVEIRKTLDVLGPDHAASRYLREVLDAHVPLRELRNDIVHGFWSAIGPNEEYLLKRKLRKIEDTSRELDLDTLVKAWERLDSLGMVVINASRAYEGMEIL
jgi:hypothetical protein